MSKKYRIGDQRHAHFVTLTVIHWVDFFIRDEYREVFIKSIQYCQQHKGLEVYGYCIMSSHIHLIVRAGEKELLENVLRDLKRYTAKCFHDLLLSEQTNYESRKSWLLKMFQDKDNKKFQFWQYGNHPIGLWSDEVFYQKLNYIHLNPVAAGLVYQPEEWRYSSAIDYAGKQGLITLVEN
jgi:putative transposase